MRNPLRRGERRDEGSLPMAMLVTLVAMSLSAALVPVVVKQFTSTRTVDARTVALDAARAGIDAAVAQLRAAGTAGSTADGVPMGKIEDLPPCTLTGSQDSGGLQDVADPTAPAVLRYRVTIAYYGVPDNATDTTPALMPCPPVDVPETAVLTATGTGARTGPLTQGSAGTRTIEATYTFKTNNENITGGAIKLAAPAAPNELCMDSGADASPAIGDAVLMQRCVAGVPTDQRWAYTTDLTIKLVNSERGDAPAGLCLNAVLPHSAGTPVTFQPCLRTASQQWSLNDGGLFQGTANGSTLDGTRCLNAQTAGAASPLVIGGCGAVSNRNVFRPQPTAGAGMATKTDVTHQVVNYKQFSRCLDVTGHDYQFSTYEIVWFCKQSPNGAVSWNQQWVLPELTTDVLDPKVERIRTTGTGHPGYCLRSPDTPSGYVTMRACPLPGAGPIPENNMKWTAYGNTKDPVTSYRIVDFRGYCLTPTDLTVTNPDTHTDGTAKVKVVPCTGDELQKWNAPANWKQPLVLTNTKEK